MRVLSLPIERSPIECDLQALLPLSLTIVSDTELESLWDQLVAEYHYLGYRNLLGRRLKYLVFSGSCPLAALSWSAPARKLQARDRFIGWSVEQRKKFIDRVVNNSRFLIFPWIRVPHLASYILARNVRRLAPDWKNRFGRSPYLLETYVDNRRFRGTSYRAANWHSVGQTSGYSKQGDTYVYHGIPKEIFVYVLNPNFRTLIGCRQRPPKPLVLSRRSFDPNHEEEKRIMILRHANWHPEIAPHMELTEEDIQRMADELQQFHQEFQACFGRPEHHRLGQAYLAGLLSNSKAKSIEPIALNLLNPGSVRSLQRFMKTYKWDQEAMEKCHQSRLAPLIASPEGMITVDSSESAKKGKESVGVARQYCGSVGKVENCQSGVFTGYTSSKGYGLLTSQLYMPESWFTEEYEQRRKENLVPEDLTFQTKLQIALQLIKKVVETGLFPARWIGCDATFGVDAEFRQSLPEGFYYFANIRSNLKVFVEKPQLGIPPYSGKGQPPTRIQVLPGEPQSQSVQELADSPQLQWTPIVLDEGAKGPIVAQVARLRVFPSQEGLPEDNAVWLFFRRIEDGEIKYAFSNAPEDMPLSEMANASIMRWPIEQCFKDGKDEVGMDHYEHRSWPAWHRHMTYVFLALHFLLRLRIQYKKKPQH